MVQLYGVFMYISTASVTSKGQISLPKKAREVIGSKMVSIEINSDNQIVLSPVIDVSGALSEYAKTSKKDYEEVRQAAWIDATKNRINN